MLRFIGGLISFLAFLCCIGSVTLWIRSRHHTDLLLVQNIPNHYLTGGTTVARGKHPLLAAGLLAAVTDLKFGGYNTTTGESVPYQFASEDPDNTRTIRDTLIDPATTVKFNLLGFKIVRGQATA